MARWPLRIAIARGDTGTRCSLPDFMRVPGTIQTLPSRSISSHRAPRTSPRRAAVRIVNSIARAVVPSTLRKATMNAGTSATANAAWCSTLRSFVGGASRCSRCPLHRAGLSPCRYPEMVAQSKRIRYAGAHGRRSSARAPKLAEASSSGPACRSLQPATDLSWARRICAASRAIAAHDVRFAKRDGERRCRPRRIRQRLRPGGRPPPLARRARHCAPRLDRRPQSAACDIAAPPHAPHSAIP